MERDAGIGGRHAIEIEYKDIIYRGINYTVGKITKLTGDPIYFIIDHEDAERVKTRSWHSCVSDSYIGSTYTTTDKKRKNLYLHNFIMNKLTFEGKGQKESIDHINRNGLDNRKTNLRLVSQTIQNINRNKMKRSAILPEGIETIPKHIWYIKANGNHGDRFGIDLKTENIKWKTSSSKTISIEDKLKLAIKKIEEFYTIYPYLRPRLT